MHKTSQQETTGFRNLSIAPKLLDAISALGYVSPTPIQSQAIPILIEGRDLFGIAQTGTGKTLAFAVPVIQQLARVKGRALVIVPTRELALQVHETFEKLGRKIGLRTAVIIGGADMRRQVRALKENPHVVVGTPGRIIDHLTCKNVKFDNVNLLVLDEADLMLDMGFAPQIERILQGVPSKRQTMLFSATMPPGIQKIAATHMADPVRIEVSPAGTVAEKVVQEVRYVRQEDKMATLESLLALHKGTALVFVRTKYAAKKLCAILRDKHFSAAEIHSNRSLAQRRAALDGFKKGKNRILVATDIAARGIDVSSVGVVVNFDLPEKAEDYVHRIGRTGRAGKEGHAVSLATPGQRQFVQRIERLIRSSIPSSGDSTSHGSEEYRRKRTPYSGGGASRYKTATRPYGGGGTHTHSRSGHRTAQSGSRSGGGRRFSYGR